jgi:hypothetical protein
MKSLPFLASVVLALVSLQSMAQFVKGNEAVETSPGAGKRVHIAPLPKTGSASGLKPCKADEPCHAGAWRMVETTDGLMECTEAYARPGTCRASSYGAVKRSRIWVVKSKGVWLQCQYPDLASKCVPIFARPPANLPYGAVQ